MADSPSRDIQSLADLIPDPQNANRGTPRGQSLLRDSLRTIGAGRSAVADRNGVVLAGNKTVAAAKALNLPVLVVKTQGEALVLVQRTDLVLGEDERARQLALQDNRIGELDLSWDPAVLKQHVDSGIALQPLWTPDELERLFGRGLVRGQIDENSVVPMRETTIQRGDLFALGPHRLHCGDATSARDVLDACGGLTPRLMVTDPPYGVSYDPTWRVRAGGQGRHAVGAVTNDDRADWREALAHFPGTVIYLWHAALHAGTAALSLTSSGFDIRAQIIWAKSRFVLGRSDYQWAHEPCWYAVRRGATSQWRGGRVQSTLWSVPNLNPISGERGGENEVTGHSTQKPVRVFELPILHHTMPGDAIYDPFLGSGTALIAAEKTGRRCIALELEPRYVQAALDRWEAYAGQRARQIKPGDRP